MSFTYEALPMRVVFGAGSLRQLPEEAERLGLRRLLLLVHLLLLLLLILRKRHRCGTA